MLAFVPAPILLVFNLILAVFYTVLVGSVIFVLGIAKLVSIWPAARDQINRLIQGCFYFWCECCALHLTVATDIQWHIQDNAELEKQANYILLSNHRSWADIVVLCVLFRRRIALPRFFLKESLRWLPFVGMAAWAMDMPFISRNKNQAADNNNLSATQRSCRKLAGQAVTLVNFAEGTRYSKLKCEQKGSRYQNLLAPKAGGVCYALNHLPQVDGIIDVSLAYPGAESATMLQLFSGRIRHLAVKVELIKTDESFLGDYQGDQAYRTHMQTFINDLWLQKDAYIRGVYQECRVVMSSPTKQYS